MDAVYKALADPSRRHLLDLLRARGGQNLGELCASLAMARQSVTKHLGVLEAAELVVVVWRGREKLHYLNPVPLHAIYARWLSRFDHAQVQALHALKRGVESCPTTTPPSSTSSGSRRQPSGSGTRSRTRS
ncbi:MAG: helix-turn-helix transcriptional regulator [Kofleriaceae bacterium]